MALIPIESPRRLPSAAAAAAWLRAAGRVWSPRTVSVRGFHTRDPARIERLVLAIEPPREHTISFQHGTLSAPARAALDGLARARFQYLDLDTADASLRLWPARHTWVHADATAAGVAAAAAILGVPLAPGKNALEAAHVTLAPGERGTRVEVETSSIPTALALFGALTDDGAVGRGFVTGVHADTRTPLLRFLSALGAQVDAVLEIGIDAARALTELYAGEKLSWQVPGVFVDFPEGRIHGYLRMADNTPRNREKWLAAVEKAWKKAGLG